MVKRMILHPWLSFMKNLQVRFTRPKSLFLKLSLFPIWLFRFLPGFKPVQYVVEAEPATSLDAIIDGNLITWLRNGTSISEEIFKRDPFLVLSLLFICLQMAILVFPIAESRMKALWASYVSSLNLERFREISQLFSRALHMVDMRRLWLKLGLVKARNFHERAMNAQAWASSLASVSLGHTSSDQSWSLLKATSSILSALERDKV